METSHSVRAYKESDYAQVVVFMLELQSYFATLDDTHEVKEFPSESEARSYIDQALRDVAEMNGAIFVAVENEKLVGFIQGVIVTHEGDVMHRLTHQEGSEGWIGVFFVDPAQRAKGIGNGLLDAMRTYFQSKKSRTMRLKVAHNNDLAMNVYKKYGFSPRDVEMSVSLVK